MDPELPDNIHISDVVVSTAGHDQGKLFYVIDEDANYLTLANGKDRRLGKPKPKGESTYIRSFALRPESPKLRQGDKVLNSELRRDLQFHAGQMQANNLGG